MYLLNQIHHSDQIRSDQSLSRVQLFATPWIAAFQASLSITNSRSSLRLTSIESVMPSSHLILCCPLLLLPPIPPSIRVFSNESTLCIHHHILLIRLPPFLCVHGYISYWFRPSLQTRSTAVFYIQVSLPFFCIPFNIIEFSFSEPQHLMYKI